MDDRRRLKGETPRRPTTGKNPSPTKRSESPRTGAAPRQNDRRAAAPRRPLNEREKQQSLKAGANGRSLKESANRSTIKESANRRQQSSQRPLSAAEKQADRRVRRAMNDRNRTVERTRRRGGNMSAYWLLFFIIVVIVFIILANTVLFNCASFETEGTVRYTAEQLIAASGIKQGDNLLHIKEKEAAERIVSSLDYIDTATVKKIYPTKVMISVKEAEKWFEIEHNGKTACISRNGKIIDNTHAGGLVVIRGFEPVSMDVGVWLESEIPAKNTIPEEIIAAAEKAGLKGITEVDITDRFSITAKIGTRITMKLGNVNDLETKFRIADTLIREQIPPTEEVVLKLDDTEKVAYQPVKNEIPLPPAEEPTAEGETAEGQSPQTAE